MAALFIVQIAVSAAVAWWVATRLVGHQQPFFAPIAAMISLGASFGRRGRAVLEMVFGVALGVLIGELLVSLIGRGAWQIGLVVALAMGLATLVGSGRLMTNQAGSSAILIAAIAPVASSSGPIYLNRFVDALVGGGVGLVVSLVLLPFNPVRAAARATDPILDQLARVLDDLASAMRSRSADTADAALQTARGMQAPIDELRNTVDSAAEVVTLSPVRWRFRGHLELYQSAIRHIDNAIRNTRVLARRLVVMLGAGEQPLPQMADAVAGLAEGVRLLRADLDRGRVPERLRPPVVQAAVVATEALPAATRLSGGAVVAQVRSLASDLLFASGLTEEDVRRLLTPEEPDEPPTRPEPGESPRRSDSGESTTRSDSG